VAAPSQRAPRLGLGTDSRIRSTQPGRRILGAVAGLFMFGGVVVGAYGLHRHAGPPEPPPGAARPVPAVLPPGLAAAPLAASPPQRVEVPAIGVAAPLLRLGLDRDGALQVPPLQQASLAGWYAQGPTPGELGPAVIVGHVDSVRSGPGVFYRLGQLRPGDTVRVTRRDGITAVFTVQSVQRVPKAAFPTQQVYGPLAYSGLRLVTCGGSFDRGSGHYRDNTVVFAYLSGISRSGR